MSDMLMIGTTASHAFKRALEVTGHNVANVGTDGYSRQRAEFMNNTPQISGGMQKGGGVTVDNIMRIQADYIQDQLVNSTYTKSRYEEGYSLSKQVEGVVTGSDAGIQEFMQRFFDSMQSLADNPTSAASRQLVMDEAYNLESHIGNISSVLVANEDEINGQIQSMVSEINNRMTLIARINDEVGNAVANNRQAPNDLLDQRDQAILELSELIDVKTYPKENGSVDVYTAGGKFPLVSDGVITRLDSGLSEYQNENRQEVYMTISGQRRAVSDLIEGGQLGGILDVRSRMVDQAKNDFGVMLNGIISAVNWQHYQGYDMNGDAGDNVFTPINVNAVRSTLNTGTDDGTGITVTFSPPAPGGAPDMPPYLPPAVQPATYGDKEQYLQNAYESMGQFQADEYILQFDGANFNVLDRQTMSVRGVVPPGVPTQIDGLQFDINAAGSFVAGDSFVIKPHQDVFEQFQLELNDPDKIAARGQSPIDSNADGSILDEVPAPDAVGGNVNMANMANLGAKKVLYSDALNAPTETLLGGYSKMTTGIGMYVRGTEIQMHAQVSVHQQVMDRRDSYSGVSLDEEAANLVKFQQAYEAAAQIISASKSMFQSLMMAVRG